MIKGETLQLTVTDAEAASVEMRFGGPQAHTIAATKSGSEFSIAQDTATWTAGVYRWQAWATYAGDIKRVIASSTVDLADGLGVGDVRTSARKMVEMIEAMMAGNASQGVRSYKINNRELERYSVAELLSLLSYWKSRQTTEDRLSRGRSSLGPRIAIRF